MIYVGGCKKSMLELENYNFKVSIISTGQAKGIEGIWQTDEHESISQSAIQKVNKFIYLATEIDLPLVTISLLCGGKLNCDINLKMGLLKSSMSKCVLCTYKKGVRLIIEPINRYEIKLINSCQDVLAFYR